MRHSIPAPAAALGADDAPDAQELDLRRAFRLLGRAARLRCPNCGGGSIFRSFLNLRPDCPTCGLELDRGEDDYFLGAYLVNLVVVELLFAAMLVGVVVYTWPDPPWDLVQYGGAALILAGAILCYPFAKTFWLAFDLILRPVDPDELPGPLGDGAPPVTRGGRPRGGRK